ncbi:hypothetical protein CAPTEDRAFT_156087 [Capitella teleta]|uniref:Transmembrane protein 183 n=1 Tax=Capitella teleta TaxID=283909 RepID=R7UQQ1_CAPTE|nr:hypothetical protein CAPTEDRAFT_156087 [Capitella teleta]|eukprot:ELU05741.1 hypothetical protein CAPTEDRAFT_156087 [Capitella teleta]
MKKSMANTDAINIIRKSLTAEENMGTLAWYEKDLSDYSDDETLTIKLQEVDDNIEKVDSTKKKKRSKLVHSESDGKIYPADLWHLISDYICPEAVRNFALLCHDSHRVTHSVCFWQRLYKRCYVSGIELPSRLQPQCIRRVHGLRSLVISALYHVYPPFSTRLQSRTPMQADPDQLLGARCLLIWYAKVKDLWHFYFKFRLPRGRRCWLRSQSAEMDLLAADDVFYNPEDGCCILQVVLQHFVSLPSCVMGQVLVQSSVSVGHAMRYHKLRLLFSTERVHGKGLLGNGTSICLDPVLNVLVTHWWSPKYPLHKP